jgi:hypothetical protein
MKTLNRRTLLRGIAGGAAVSIALPPLEIFMNANGTAYADGSAFPKRFGVFFWGNGVIPSKWNPRGEGAGWELSEQLMPLANVKSEITVVSGTNVLTGNSIPHWSGTAGILSGAPLIVRGDEGTFSTPSIDQVLAQRIGGETRFKSLEIGVRPSEGLSYNGADSRNPPESSPRRLFERLFGGGFQLPGAEPIHDPKLRLRRSVLDAVMSDAQRVMPRLSTKDRARLDQHLTGVRELERRIARLEENPPSFEACALPRMPAESYPDIDGRPQLSEISRIMGEILAMALACDQTRVFTNVFTYPVNNVLFAGTPAGHHQLTHDEPGDQPTVSRIVQAIMTELAAFLEALRAVPEGEGTLLDHCAVLCTSDTSFGRLHALEDYPILIAGTASGALVKGIHYRSATGENSSRVLLTLLRAMGVPLAEFGVEGGRVTEGIGAIEARG